MKKIAIVVLLVFSFGFSLSANAGIFGGNWFDGMYDSADSTMSDVANGIAGSFSPDSVNIGESNGQMNGQGTDRSDWGTHNFNQEKSFFSPAASDASMSYLGRIFGNVGAVVNGDGIPLLGQLFGIFNTALMGLGIIIVTYLVFKGVLDSAAHGEFLGKQMNSVWVPIRVVSGILLLIPKKSGYCIAQILVMYVIVMGVGAADTVWNKALTYFQNGGAMSPVAWQSSQAESSTEKSVESIVCSAFGIACTQADTKEKQAYNKAVNEQHQQDAQAYQVQKDGLEGSMKQVFESLVCMHSFAKYADKPYRTPTMTTNGATSSYHFIAQTNSPQKPTFNCGSVSWDNAGVAGQAATTAMHSQVLALSTIAKHLVDTQQNQSVDYKNDKKTTVIDPERQREVYRFANENFLSTTANSYHGDIINAKTQDKAPETQYNQFMDNARNIGWIFAGAYFHNIISLENKVTMIDIPKVTEPEKFSEAGSYLFTPESTDYTFSRNFSTNVLAASASAQGPLDGTVSDFLPENEGGHYTNTTCRKVKKGWWIFSSSATECTTTTGNSAADYLYNNIRTAFGYLYTNTNIQPMLALQNVGRSLLHTISQTISGIVTINDTKSQISEDGSNVSSALSMIPFFGNSLSSMNNAAMQAKLSEMTSFQGLLIALVSALMLPAATLAVYIPLLPYVLFSIGVIGWFLTVFEAVVAAPIVALGVLHPEGHDAYGKAQPAVMLLVNVFVKPMLMIIGLLAAILISDAAVSFINAGFSAVVGSTYNQSDILTTYSTDLALLSVLLLFLYVAIILAIINKCYQLIYVVPDRVLRWLDNFIPGGQDEGQVLQEAKGEFTQSVNEGKQLGSKGLETAVAFNDAENKKTQETATAQAGVAKAAMSAAATGAKAAAGAPPSGGDELGLM